MLWYAARTCEPGSAQHRRLVLATCGCARLALRYVPKGEHRPRQTIETAERWARGKASLEDVCVAADAAYAAYAADDVTYAAYAAAYAYAATYAAAVATNAVTYAAAVATDAAQAASSDAARRRTLAKCADIVRQHFPRAPRGRKP
jgi:hypothetical protein